MLSCSVCNNPIMLDGDSMSTGQYWTHVVSVGHLFTQASFDREDALDQDHEPVPMKGNND